MIKPDKIIRTRRKTISLVVTSDAQLIIRVPNETTDEYIEWLVEKKQNWIKKKISHVRSLNVIHDKHEFVDGEGFLFLGKWLRLQIKKRQNTLVVSDSNFLFLKEEYLQSARQTVRDWYIKNAKKIITDRVNWFVDNYDFNYSKITITDAKKRWGSCGHKNTLNFSWRLVMAPMEVIDYVVVHELCHTVEKNHSSDYWIKVKTILPKFKKAINWLEQNQRLMDL